MMAARTGADAIMAATGMAIVKAMRAAGAETGGTKIMVKATRTAMSIIAS